LKGNPARCLFCKAPLDGSEPPEHLIPQAIGGWITTRHVCGACNHKFGHILDKSVVDHGILLALRTEVGLPIRQDPGWEIMDPEFGETTRVRLMADGSVKPVKPVHDDGKRVTIRGDREKEVREMARKIAERHRREGRVVSYGDPEPVASDPTLVRMVIPFHDARSLEDSLSREAAKIAIEYIDVVASQDIALLPELDSIREFARGGDAFAGARAGHRAPVPSVRLPRTNRVLILGEGKQPNQEEGDAMMNRMAPELADDSIPDMSAVPEWPGFVHRLGLVRDPSGTRFELTLFTAMVATVAISPSLPLPWGSFDQKDLISGVPERYHPWGSPPVILP
jgi:hypothetical protein